MLLLLFLFACTCMAFAQERTVSGKITDDSTRLPIAAATITVKGSRKSISAAADGSFTISVPAGKFTLIVSSVGFATREVTAEANGIPLDIRLSTDSKQMGEVVVTALGIARQSKTLVYAAQSVPTQQLTEVRPTDNFIASLNGKVANVIITQGSGGLGSGAQIILRGNRSIAEPSNALIVVDGVPFNNRTYSAAGNDFGSIQSSDGASDLNPDDIESMTVLRGPSAAALYGSEAGNGVIVIATKKGHPGRYGVQVNSGIGFERPFALPNFQNTYGQGSGGVIAADSSQAGASWGAKMTGQSYIDYLYKQNTYSPQPNNVKDLFNTGLSLNNSVGVSGGTDKIQNYFSYTNNYAKGIIPHNDLNRHIFDYRVTDQLAPGVTLDAKATYIAQVINGRPRTGEENSPVFDAYEMPRSMKTSDARNYQAPNSNGIESPTNWPSTQNSIYQNPYWMLNNTSITETRERAVGFVSLKYAITPWLNVRGSANLDRTADEIDEKYQQGTLLWNTNAGGSFIVTNLVETNKWFDLIFEGHNNFARDFKVGYHAGLIREDDIYDQKQIGSNGLEYTNKFSLTFLTNPTPSQAGTEVITQSAFGQANFSWRDAIFLDASLREDWNSTLPSPYHYSYPSVGLSAVLSDLFKDGLPPAISFLKVSGNYAEVGNGGTPNILNSTYTFFPGAGSGSVARNTTFPIPGLLPEKVKGYEFGLEARFLQDRLGFTATYYKSNATNQLLTISTPVATGYSNQYINAGNVENHGLEITVNATPVHERDFNWDISANFSLNRNKVISLSPQLKTVMLGGADNRSAQPEVNVGGSFGDLYGFIWKKDAKGNLEVQNSGDFAGAPLTTYITGDPISYLGNYNPRYLAGLTNTFQYKRFTLRFLIDGRIGGIVVSGTEMNLSFDGITKNTASFREGGLNLHGVDVNGAPVNTSITAQQFWQTASGLRYGVGQFFVYDATSFRVREFSLGYDIPLKNTTILKSLRFSAVARNLFWIYRGSTKLDIPGIGKRKMWMDPDMTNGNGLFQGVEYGALPSTRTLGFNLKANF